MSTSEARTIPGAAGRPGSAGGRLAWGGAGRAGVALLLGLITGGGCGSEAQRSTGIERKPRSVLLITLDTTRPDRLEPYGAEDVETPNLARLAARGTVLTRAYAVAPVTSVAHASLLTGLYPPQHGVRNNGTHYLEPGIATLAEALSGSGYRTGAFVSAAVLERRYGLDQGFEVYDDDLSTSRGRDPHIVPDRPAEAVVDAALAWLERLAPRERFFLWVHFYDPHANYSPPPPFRDRYRDRLYEGEIAYMDREIGRLLAHPRLAADVAVSVVGDHGESLGEHEEQTHGILAYDSTLWIPWILRLPEVAPGRRLAEPVSQIDLVPTLLDLLDLEPDPELPGRSLLPLIEGSAEAPDRPLYAESLLPRYTYGWAELRVLRRGDLKLIEGPAPELYDVGSDPRERRSILSRRPGVARELRSELAALGSRFEGWSGASELEVDPEAIERLRSLGYLGAVSTAPPAEPPDPRQMISIHVDLEWARTLMRTHRWPEAIERLEAALGRDPTNLAVLQELGSAQEQTGDLEAAVGSVERALALAPDDPLLLRRLALLDAQRGNAPAAIELLQSALAAQPRYLAARLDLARLLARIGQAARGRELLDAALAANPDHAGTLIEYAWEVEVRGGDLAAAEERLERAVALDPWEILGWSYLGRLRESTGRVEAAASAYREGLARRPDSGELHAQLGLLLARRVGAAEAEGHLREAIRLLPRPRADLHLALGAWLGEEEHFEEALEEYAAVLALEPGHPGARNNRAIALWALDRVAEARGELERLAADRPDFADPLVNLAVMAIEADEPRAAERYARRALGLDDGLARAWTQLAAALLRLDELSEARRALARALELDAADPETRRQQARLEERSGNLGRAAGLLEELLREEPTSADLHLRLGTLYAGGLEDPERARLHFNACLRYAPAASREAGAARRQLDALARRDQGGGG